MRIAIDARYVTDHFPGIGRYMMNLITALGKLEHDHTLIVFYNPDLPNTRYPLDILQSYPSIRLLSISAKPFSPAEHIQLPHLARVVGFDLLHNPYYVKPYVGIPCPSIVTIYDLIMRRFPHLLPSKTRLVFRVATYLAIHTSQRIITISDSSRNDILTYYRLAPSRVVVTPGAADQQFVPQPAETIAALRTRYNLPPRYLLYLGANKPHKNLERLVQAWAQVAEEAKAGVQLVLAGHYDPRYPQAYTLVQELGLSSQVTFLHNVAEEELPVLYSGAECFVFPSYYEGFGLPVLEAMASGTPVICSQASSLPEVVGDAALLFDPYDVSNIAHCLHTVLTQPGLRDDLRKRGLSQVQQFSWERTARETLAVYETLG